MPKNRSASDLLKKTQEVLDLCRQKNEPIFLEDDRQDEIVMMSRTYFNRLWNLLVALEREQTAENRLTHQSFHVRSLEKLYRKLSEAQIAIRQSKIYTHEEVMAKLRD